MFTVWECGIRCSAVDSYTTELANLRQMATQGITIHILSLLLSIALSDLFSIALQQWSFRLGVAHKDL